MKAKVLRWLPKYKTLVGWGTGSYFDECIKYFNINLDYLVDNNKRLRGMLKCGVKIYTPQKLWRGNRDESIVIIFSSFSKEIQRQLKKNGFTNYVDVKKFGDLFKGMLKKEAAKEPERRNSRFVEMGYLAIAGSAAVAKNWRSAIAALEALEEMIGVTKASSRLLGIIYAKTLRWEDGLKRLEQAARLGCEDWFLYYNLYICAYRLGIKDSLKESRIIVESSSHCHGKLNIGDLLYADGYLDMALDCYKNMSSAHLIIGDIKFAMMDWKGAELAYSAYAGKSDLRKAFYSRGLCWERMKKYGKAVECYRKLIAAGPINKPGNITYRVGKSLYGSGLFNESSLEFYRYFTSISEDLWTDEKFQFPPVGELFPKEISKIISDGDCSLRSGNRSSAIESYRRALWLSSDHHPNIFVKLGIALYLSSRHKESAEAFINSRCLDDVSINDGDFCSLSKSAKIITLYRNFYKSEKVFKGGILYESFFGNNISCNPRSLLDEMLAGNYYPRGTHTVCVNDRNHIPVELMGLDKVRFIRRQSYAYLKELSTAEILINNVTFPAYFQRKKEQKYINTWHGTPLKFLGRDAESYFMDYINVARNMIQATGLVFPNRYTEEKLLESLECRDLISADVVTLGHARCDKTLNADALARLSLKRQLRIKDDRPVVLYAPTWRGKTGSVKVEVDRLIRDISHLSNLPVNFLFRGHHFSTDALRKGGLGEYLVDERIDTNHLLSIVDVLVTDYSSIYFDFLITRKPIVHYLYDWNSYMAERGAYLGSWDLPGLKCDNIRSLRKLVKEAALSVKSGHWIPGVKYKKCIEEYSYMEDGLSSKRICEWIKGSRVGYSAKSVKPILYLGDCGGNGITHSLRYILRAYGDRIVAALSPSKVRKSRVAVKLANDLLRGNRVPAIGIDVMVCADLDERRARKMFLQSHCFHSSRAERVYRGCVRDDYCRQFGAGVPVKLICYDGYDQRCVELFATVQNGMSKKIIYQHNTMGSERRLKFPYLDRVFHFYKDFDTLVNVSRTVMNENMAYCSKMGVGPEKFVNIGNRIDVDEISSRANEEIESVEVANFLSMKSNVFVCVGRLSPEKNHELLLEAFAIEYRDKSNFGLVILGDGPLRSNLEASILRMGLQDRVLIAGYVGNPYPIIRKAIAVVLSSRHEGQPLIIFEALSLCIPVVSVVAPGLDWMDRELGYIKMDPGLISSPRAISAPGIMTDSSPDGLCKGMQIVSDGLLTYIEPSLDRYFLRWRRTFEEVVL